MGVFMKLLFVGAAAAVVCVSPGCSSSDSAPDATSSGLFKACDIDCSTIAAPTCQTASCDTTTGQCVLSPLDGAACDDGLFCTVNDTCHGGVCSGDANDCGLSPITCKGAECNEATHTCHYEQQPDGFYCADSKDVCTVGGACQSGSCVLLAKTCHFELAPDECHVASCNPTTGACDVFVAGNEGMPCHSDPCVFDGVCQSGKCMGTPRDCSFYADDCNTASCDSVHGGCFKTPGPAGVACAKGDACNTGACNAAGLCTLVSKNEGVACASDAVSCSTKNACHAGTCQGTTTQSIYFQDAFASNIQGWTFEGAWAVGAARDVASFPGVSCKPSVDHTGSPDNGIATTGIGGRDGDVAHDFQYLTSRIVDTSGAQKVLLVFSEMSGLPLPPYARGVAEVYDGAKWVNVWEHAGGAGDCYDVNNFIVWTTVTVDVTAQKNAAMRVRFGTQYEIANPTAGLSIDDVSLVSAACP